VIPNFRRFIRDFTQHRLVVCYVTFGTLYRPLLYGSGSPRRIPGILKRKLCGRGLKSQKSEYLRVAVYFGSRMKSIITLFEKHTDLFKVKLLCAVNGSKTTAKTVSTKRL
jgi:hypothetical protein